MPTYVLIPTIITVSTSQFDNKERSMHRSVTDSNSSKNKSNSQQHEAEKDQNLMPMTENISPPATTSPRQCNILQIWTFKKRYFMMGMIVMVFLGPLMI